MPNIEIHGYGENAAAMRQKIVEVLKDSPEADEVVTTVFPTDVEDLKGTKTPYLRLISGSEDLQTMVDRLVLLVEDVEVIALAKWLPKKK